MSAQPHGVVDVRACRERSDTRTGPPRAASLRVQRVTIGMRSVLGSSPNRRVNSADTRTSPGTATRLQRQRRAFDGRFGTRVAVAWGCMCSCVSACRGGLEGSVTASRGLTQERSSTLGSATGSPCRPRGALCSCVVTYRRLAGRRRELVNSADTRTSPGTAARLQRPRHMLAWRAGTRVAVSLGVNAFLCRHQPQPQ